MSNALAGLSYTSSPSEAAEQISAFCLDLYNSTRLDLVTWTVAVYVSRFRDQLRRDRVDLERFEDEVTALVIQSLDTPLRQALRQWLKGSD